MKRFHVDAEQRGAVAVVVAFMLVVLIAAAGIVLDLGRLFVNKAELQNAADACALAAARELMTPNTAETLTRAENAGVTVGRYHRHDFQENAVVFVRDQDITFSTALDGVYVTKGAAPADVRYVKCTRSVDGFLPWFMQVFGNGPKSVGAIAVAWAQPGTPTCPIPLGMCSKVTNPTPCTNGTTPDSTTGLCIGQWYSGRFGSGGGINGNFNWLDFSGGGGGSNEVQEGLEGCVPLEDPIEVGDFVDAKAGVLGASAGTSWNTRFGLYKNGAGNPSAASGAVPDTTGYSYTLANWAQGKNAYDDYKARRDGSHDPYGPTTAQGNTVTGLTVSSSYHTLTSAEHAAGEAGRRLIAMPTVDCSSWGPGHQAVVTGWVCALMLTPYQGPNDDVVLEYRGVAGAAGVPCATYGHPGGSGPRVPTLVQ